MIQNRHSPDKKAAGRLTKILQLIALGTLLSACSSGSDSTGPGGTNGGGDSTPVSILVELNAGGGTVSATLAGKSYSSSPGFVTVPSGTQEISGTFTGSFLQVSFGGFVDGGGVEMNSVQNVSGPSPTVAKCSVTYNRTGAGSSSFRLQFKVVTKVGGHC